MLFKICHEAHYKACKGYIISVAVFIILEVLLFFYFFFIFGSDYGWERQADGKCAPAFWFNPNGAAKSCSTSQSFLNSTG